MAPPEAERRIYALDLLDAAAAAALNGQPDVIQETVDKAETAYIESVVPLELTMPHVAAGNFVNHYGGFWPRRLRRREQARERLRDLSENLGDIALGSER